MTLCAQSSLQNNPQVMIPYVFVRYITFVDHECFDFISYNRLGTFISTFPLNLISISFTFIYTTEHVIFESMVITIFLIFCRKLNYINYIDGIYYSKGVRFWNVRSSLYVGLTI